MKNRFILPYFFYFTSVLSLLLHFGCGDTEDEQAATTPTNNTFLGELDEPSRHPAEQQRWLTDEDRKKLKDAEKWVHLTVEDWVNLKDRDWEKLKGKDWVRLTNAEVRKFMNLEIPKGWVAETKDEALREKFRTAAFFQKFGDIPQARYNVEFRRNSRKMAGKDGFIPVTPEFAKYLVADRAANYFLFPTEAHRRLLEDEIKQLKRIIEQVIAQEERRLLEEELRALEQLRIEDPQTWIKGMRAFLIKEYGDIPEVDTIANFLRKVELNLPRTDEECHTYLKAYNTLYVDSDDFGSSSRYEYYATFEAVDQVRPIVADKPLQILEKYREARAEGISFYNIDWDDD
jgi:hypothetical protein